MSSDARTRTGRRVRVAAAFMVVGCLMAWSAGDAALVRRGLGVVVVRYGAVWVALAGVVVLALAVSRRPARRRPHRTHHRTHHRILA